MTAAASRSASARTTSVEKSAGRAVVWSLGGRADEQPNAITAKSVASMCGEWRMTCEAGYVPSSATRPTRAHDCNREAMAGVAAHG